MTENKVEVVAPLRVSERQIHVFVESQQDWISSTTVKIKRKLANIKTIAPEVYCDSAVIPFYGKPTKISVKTSIKRKVAIEFEQNGITIYLPTEMIKIDNSELIRQHLTHWLKNKALQDVKQYVDKHVDRYKLQPRSIKIKTQKSRWGSCGIHNDINLNWLLILAPAEVFEYVVVHEICHIKERNHSSRFWQLVEAHLPEYKKQQNWLKRHGTELMQGL